jgi:enoyl-CoA hydratase/carnithine racemase
VADNLVLVDREHGVGVLTLNRPERRNALGVKLVEALALELGRLERDRETRVIVLAATAPGFCAGADLKEFAGTDVATMCREDAGTAALARSFALASKPVIAAVDGFALGGGFMLAASCDIVVSAPETRWRLPEVSLGWLPGWGLQALSSRVGANKARRLALSAELFDGREAHRLGLADYLTSDGETALQAALNRARPIAQFSPHALASVKRFFLPSVASSAEAMDALAGHFLAADATQPHGQATLERFNRQ